MKNEVTREEFAKRIAACDYAKSFNGLTNSDKSAVLGSYILAPWVDVVNDTVPADSKHFDLYVQALQGYLSEFAQASYMVEATHGAEAYCEIRDAAARRFTSLALEAFLANNIREINDFFDDANPTQEWDDDKEADYRQRAADL